MKKVILMPDSFKGTMSSSEICGIMEKAVRAYYPDAEVVPIPVADGGEGSVDAFLAAVRRRAGHSPREGPYMEEMEGYYGLLDGGSTAVIEMAACAGPAARGGEPARRKDHHLRRRPAHGPRPRGAAAKR